MPEHGGEWKMVLKERNNPGEGLGEPMESQKLTCEIPMDCEDQKETFKVAREFSQDIVKAMKVKGFSDDDAGKMQLALAELTPDVQDFCEGPCCSMTADVSASQVKVTAKWTQCDGVDLPGIAHERKKEIDRAAEEGPDAIRESYSKRVEGERAKGRDIGGMGVGLVLIDQFMDEFTSSFDKTNNEMTVVMVKNRTEG